MKLNASVDYYEECKTNLGSEFAYEVQKTIQRILKFPTAWQKIDGERYNKYKETNNLPSGKIIAYNS
jgi:hypothetical protein